MATSIHQLRLCSVFVIEENGLNGVKISEKKTRTESPVVHAVRGLQFTTLQNAISITKKRSLRHRTTTCRISNLVGMFLKMLLMNVLVKCICKNARFIQTSLRLLVELIVSQNLTVKFQLLISKHRAELKQKMRLKLTSCKNALMLLCLKNTLELKSKI